MYHDLSNIKEDMDVINMNYGKGTDETSTAEPKCWKRCDTSEKCRTPRSTST